MLLPWASELTAADAAFRSVLTPEVVAGIVELLPDEWLLNYPGASSGEGPAAIREVYREFLTTRILASDIFIKEAMHARKATI